MCMHRMAHICVCVGGGGVGSCHDVGLAHILRRRHMHVPHAPSIHVHAPYDPPVCWGGGAYDPRVCVWVGGGVGGGGWGGGGW
jgi:hypothetical protein